MLRTKIRDEIAKNREKIKELGPGLITGGAGEREEKKSVVQADEVGFDTVEGMVYSNLLAYCIIITGAVMIYGKGADIQDVTTLSLALKPAAGDLSFTLFSIGITLLISNNKKIIEEYTSSRFTNIFSLLAMAVTLSLGIYMFYGMWKG